mmetsp:Transcript_33372/g.66176  ORF Transcript_33372/g.66176 Transcript_33372/m.66176 type:complete len:92 (+) Transcript_33372:38-313(+)
MMNEENEACNRRKDGLQQAEKEGRMSEREREHKSKQHQTHSNDTSSREKQSETRRRTRKKKKKDRERSCIDASLLFCSSKQNESSHNCTCG